MYYTDRSVYVEVYQVGVCIGDTRGDVCANGITNEVALLFCRSRGLFNDYHLVFFLTVW